MGEVDSREDENRQQRSSHTAQGQQTADTQGRWHTSHSANLGSLKPARLSAGDGGRGRGLEGLEGLEGLRPARIASTLCMAALAPAQHQ